MYIENPLTTQTNIITTCTMMCDIKVFLYKLPNEYATYCTFEDDFSKRTREKTHVSNATS